MSYGLIMGLKKRQKQLPHLFLVSLISILFLISILNILDDLTKKVSPELTTEAISNNYGVASICINHPPTITAIADQTATVGTAFTLQVTAADSDGNTLTYSDNSSLFAISQAGAISFTPVAGDIGTSSVLISVSDSTACLNTNASTSFLLTVDAAVDGGGGVTGGNGGGGGGGGGGSPVKMEIVNLVLSSKPVEQIIIKNTLLAFTWMGFSHTIETKNIDDSGVTLLVSSTPTIVTLELEESQEVDLNDDRIPDIEISLRSLDSGQAVLRLTVLREGIVLSDDVIKVSLRQSQLLEKRLVVVQDWMTDLEVTLSATLENLLSIDPNSFTLLIRGKQPVLLIFNPARDAVFGVYMGKIVVDATGNGNDFEKAVSVIIEVESDSVLLDGGLDISEKTLKAGDELRATVSVFNLMNIPVENVTLIYEIRDSSNGVVYTEQELISLDKQVSFTKTIPLLLKMESGNYVLSLKMIYKDSFATATEQFSIEGVPHFGAKALVGRAAAAVGGSVVLWSLAGLFILVVIILSYLLFVHEPGHLGQVRERIVMGPNKVIKQVKIIREDSSIHRKLSALQEGYKEGFITQQAYNKGKSKLTERIVSRRK